VTIERINPPTLEKPRGYSHAHVASGTRTVYLAGESAYDASGTLVGAGDYRAQARQAMLNVGHALEAAGASPTDVVRLGIYVVRHGPEVAEDLWAGLAEASKEIGMRPVPTTLLGVHSLVYPEMLVEIDAIAVLD
jgi:enamine deaminase RidA (YjgF/YER057c/UK114 family)